MPVIKDEDIVGYRHNDQIWCVDCWNETKGDTEITLDMIILGSEVNEESLFFCDICDPPRQLVAP